ncbi:MAG: PLDc N-terminal domain-containing protein [Micrococcus sp.]|nr:PLDc N-terminal domain-containing protein [Micrococcus sp.]
MTGFPLYYVIIALLVIAWLALVVTALLSVLRSPHLHGAATPVWILVILFFPVAGSLLWLLIARPYMEGAASRT